MSSQSYFALVDSVDVLGENGGLTAIRLDAIPTESLPILAGINSFVERLGEARPVMIDIKPVETNRAVEFFETAIDGLESQWFNLSLSTRGLAGTLFTDPAAIDGQNVRLSGVRRPNAQEYRWLSRLGSLDPEELPDASMEQLEDLLFAKRQRRAKHRMVGAYPVGQGNLNAILDGISPRLYFDLGGGAGRNASTYPTHFRICHTGEVPVLLSHWDTDHWITARKDPRCLEHHWIVPRQNTGRNLVGPTHLKLAADLHRRGHLHIWPSGLPYLSTAYGEIHLCRGKSKNDSGLAMRAYLGNGVFVLLPGDADYGVIPSPLLQDLSGIVVSHHGALVKSPPPRAAPPVGVIPYAAFSFGTGNSYGHPNPTTRAALSSVGFGSGYDTPNGGIRFPSIGKKSPGCGGRACDLLAPQP